MEPIVAILLVAVILLGLYWLCSKFTSGTPLNIIGIVLAVILVLYALNRLGLMGTVHL